MSSWNPNDPYAPPPNLPPQGPPQYGPPQYGPPQYGPPQYGPPQYGPPQYGQPQYGQPQYGQYPGPPYPPPYGGPGFGMPPAPVPGGRRAGMGERFGGLLLDALVLAVPVVILGVLTGAFHTGRTCNAFGDCTNGFTFRPGIGVDLLGLAIGVAYSAWLVGTTGQTLGHRAVGIRVVDVATGGLIGPGRAALRWLVMSLTGLLCTLGYWSPFFDSERRQGWHDKATRSVTIPAR